MNRTNITLVKNNPYFHRVQYTQYLVHFVIWNRIDHYSHLFYFGTAALVCINVNIGHFPNILYSFLPEWQGIATFGCIKYYYWFMYVRPVIVLHHIQTVLIKRHIFICLEKILKTPFRFHYAWWQRWCGKKGLCEFIHC